MSPRAPKKCGNYFCETRILRGAYCTEHTPTWVGSTRRARLPADWPELRAATAQRANGRCEAEARLGVTHHPDCTRIGSDCDHITAGDNHSPTNLCWLSAPCHRAKTARETRDRNRNRARR